MLTAERLRELLDYEPATGIFRWKLNRGKGVKDNVAGSSDKNGYREICVDQIAYKAHRLAFLWMTGAFPANEVDHTNRDKSDNRWSNLRPATHAQNGWNRGLHHANTTGLKGVEPERRTGRYVARITANNKRISLGTFATAQEAHEAYMKKARELHGDFARAA